jgi:hypothetical protein
MMDNDRKQLKTMENVGRRWKAVEKKWKTMEINENQWKPMKIDGKGWKAKREIMEHGEAMWKMAKNGGKWLVILVAKLRRQIMKNNGK